jgi:hypothetical protein
MIEFAKLIGGLAVWIAIILLFATIGDYWQAHRPPEPPKTEQELKREAYENVLREKLDKLDPDIERPDDSYDDDRYGGA